MFGRCRLSDALIKNNTTQKELKYKHSCTLPQKSEHTQILNAFVDFDQRLCFLPLGKLIKC